MKRYTISFTTAFTLVVLGAPGFALAAGGGSAPNAPSGTISQSPTISSEQQQADKFNVYVSKKGEPVKNKGNKPDHATIMSNVQALVQSLPLSCTVTDADLIAEGPATVDGNTVNTNTYEVACGNGTGYFLVSLDSGNPYGFSCFVAEATRVADIAAGRAPGAVCSLPANADMKAMATSIINRAGTNCTVRDLKRIGQSTKSNTEYNEVACNDGKGYVLATALPGSTLPVIVASCHNSALQGIPCKLSDNGILIARAQDFKNALAQHNIPCDATDMRSIGQESLKKRHVVEFLCPQQQPKGLVAFIPLDGNTAPFETIDCAGAAKRGVVCKLTTAK
ncbi:MAG: hypothetical protein WCA78_07940 [Rhizomicrobium sp.]